MRTSFKVAQEKAQARKAEKVKAQALALKGPGALGIAKKEKAQAKEEAREALEKAAKEKEEQAFRDLKLPAVKSYALCDEPHEVAECKAFADAMYQRITGKPYRSRLEAAEEKAAAESEKAAGVGGVGNPWPEKKGLATPIPENTFVTVLIDAGMKPQDAQRLADFFEFGDWKGLCGFTDKIIEDIRAGELGDASGDFVVSEEDLKILRSTAQLCRRVRDQSSSGVGGVGK
jgi:hypothetical protein